MDKTFITKLVADAIKYLGDKIDKSNGKIEMDLTSRAIEKLQDVDYRQINTLIKEMKEVANGHSKSNKELITTLQAFEKATKDDTRLINVLSTSQGLQGQMVTALDLIGKQLKDDSESEDDNEDKAILESLKSIKTAIYETESEEKEIDLKPLIKEINQLRTESNTQGKQIVTALEKMCEDMSKLPKSFDFPKEFKFNTEQLRSIRSAGGGGGMSFNGGLKVATNWAVATKTLTLANTEYSYTFPTNTQSWTMKLRVGGASLYYASATGKLPMSGDNSTYMTMLPMGARSQDNVEWSGKTIYFESDTAGQIVEVEVFTL